MRDKKEFAIFWLGLMGGVFLGSLLNTGGELYTKKAVAPEIHISTLNNSDTTFIYKIKN